MRPERAKASGDKRYEFMLLPFQGVSHRCTIPQGVALGYELLPLQGEAWNTEARRHGEYFLSFLKIQRIKKLRGSVAIKSIVNIAMPPLMMRL